MHEDLRDKHIVVTGGTGALGEAVTRLLAERGATCHLPCIEDKPRQLDVARATLTAGVDVADEAAVSRYFAGLPPLWASVHIAGGFAMAGVLDTSLEAFHAMMRMNAVTCFLSCREAIRAIAKTGAGGRIVNVAARAVVTPSAQMVAYNASKAAVASITQTLAAECLGQRIYINAVMPSIIDSAANRQAMPSADFAKWPKPLEIAQSIAYLVSPSNTLSTGALLPVFGQS